MTSEETHGRAHRVPPPNLADISSRFLRRPFFEHSETSRPIAGELLCSEFPVDSDECTVDHPRNATRRQETMMVRFLRVNKSYLPVLLRGCRILSILL